MYNGNKINGYSLPTLYASLKIQKHNQNVNSYFSTKKRCSLTLDMNSDTIFWQTLEKIYLIRMHES